MGQCVSFLTAECKWIRFLWLSLKVRLHGEVETRGLELRQVACLERDGCGGPMPRMPESDSQAKLVTKMKIHFAVLSNYGLALLVLVHYWY